MKNSIWLVAILAVSRLCAAEPTVVDFRYAPPQWQASICLPDDPYKTLVDQDGRLLYHYASGNHVNGVDDFKTFVQVVIDPNVKRSGQRLHAPRVPIVRTTGELQGLTIVSQAFAIPRTKEELNPPESITRRDGHAVNLNWARPIGTGRMLTHIDLHNNGALEYQITVQPSSRATVAIGLCEGWHDQAGQRVMELKVEGAESQTVDPFAILGKNKPGVFSFAAADRDGNGLIDVHVNPATGAVDRNTILNALWVFPPNTDIDAATLLANAQTKSATAVWYPSQSVGRVSRNDVLLVELKNRADQPRTVRPQVMVGSELGVRTMNNNRLQINHHETVLTTHVIDKIDLAAGGKRGTMTLAPITVPGHGSATFAVVYCGGGTIETKPDTLDTVLTARKTAFDFWRNAPLPYDRVVVPDRQIQALVDSSIRNIWQAREIKAGLPAFQVGPTCYRGLWIVDGAFLLEAATMLDAGMDARAGIEYTLSFQQEDGRFEILPKYWKENGIVPWTCIRHAQLTQDKQWLRKVWPKLVRAIEFVRVLRKRTFENDTALDDGLIPPGFPDGGIGRGDRCEYTNVYWILAGLKTSIQAARWLGYNDQAGEWQEEFDELYTAFRKAALRDMATDDSGNRYLPTLMDQKEASQDLPQRGQWAFCHGVYPGQLFERNDPLVVGTLKMLEATEREGMVYGTGWDPTGLWNYFASFYGHAWLWEGRGGTAADSLYAMANHSSPVLTWREEQSPKGTPFHKVGDMPHNWASAEFIRLTVHLLALDRGRELHLLQGLPLQWAKPGMVTRLDGVATPFGPLTMKLTFAQDGNTARLRIEPVDDSLCERVVVHLGRWANADNDATLTLEAGKAHDLKIPIPPFSGTRQRIH